MLRRATLAAAVALLGTVVLPAAPAAAGAGCHSDPTTGSGDTVEMLGLCFTPTTLRVDPGATVTFVNRDPTVHNLSAHGWGNLDPMTKGDTFAASFEDPGIYPYACTYHAGMTGAIVVGATAPATGTADASRIDSTVADDAHAVSAETGVEPHSAGADAVAGVGGGAIGLGLGLGSGVAARRRASRGAAAR
jgi:plastocyanin